MAEMLSIEILMTCSSFTVTETLVNLVSDAALCYASHICVAARLYRSTVVPPCIVTSLTACQMIVTELG